MHGCMHAGTGDQASQEGGRRGGEVGEDSGRRRRRDTGGQTKHNQEAKRNTIRKSGRDYQSGGRSGSLLIVLILFMAADAFISKAVKIPGAARQDA